MKMYVGCCEQFEIELDCRIMKAQASVARDRS
jgi:hypothetical protein